MTILVSEIQETLFRPSKALFMDEISTGLESSTAFQMVNSIKQYVYILMRQIFFFGWIDATVLSTAAHTLDLSFFFLLFIFLSNDHIVYQVPHELVLECFAIRGLQMSWLDGMTDFWQEASVNCSSDIC